MKKYFMLLCVVAMVLFIAQMNYAQNKSSIDATDSLEVAIDSLDVICQDSIQESQIESEDEQKTARLYEINKQLTFDNFVELIKNFTNEDFGKKCGLSLIKKENSEGMNYYYYGRGVVDSKIDSPTSEHACSLGISMDSDGTKIGQIQFKDSDDADLFFNRAKEYGLLIEEGVYFKRYFVPQQKLPNGSIILNEVNDYLVEIIGPSEAVGWYIYMLSFK